MTAQSNTIMLQEQNHQSQPIQTEPAIQVNSAAVTVQHNKTQTAINESTNEKQLSTMLVHTLKMLKQLNKRYVVQKQQQIELANTFKKYLEKARRSNLICTPGDEKQQPISTTVTEMPQLTVLDKQIQSENEAYQQKQIELLKLQNARLQQQQQKLRNDIAELISKNSQMKQEMDRIIVKGEQRQNIQPIWQTQSVDNTNQSLKQSITLEPQQIEHIKQIESLRQEITNLTNEKQVLKLKLTDTEQVIHKLNQTIKNSAKSMQLEKIKLQKQNLSEQVSILQQINRSLVQKQQEFVNSISTMKQHIGKLQQQVKQKQGEFMQLLSGSNTDKLQAEITSKNKQISELKARILGMSENNKRKQQELIQLKQQYSAIQHFKHNQLTANQLVSVYDLSDRKQSSSSSYSSKEKQEDILQAELEIMRCKYRLLQKMYMEQKLENQDNNDHEHSKRESPQHDNQNNNNQRPKSDQDSSQSGFEEVQVDDNRYEVAVQTQNLSQNINIDQDQCQIYDLQVRKSVSNGSERILKKTLSGTNLMKPQNNLNHNKHLDISITDKSITTLHNKNSTAMNSPVASISNFTSFFNLSQFQTRIVNFEYNNSILHKVNVSKFITSPSAKIAFVFQYVCILEMYFTHGFLAGIMEEMIMGQSETVQLRKINKMNINPQLWENVDGNRNQRSRMSYTNSNNNREDKLDISMVSNSRSSRMNNSKMMIANQFSMNNYSQVQQPESLQAKLKRLSMQSSILSINFTTQFSLQPCRVSVPLMQLIEFIDHLFESGNEKNIETTINNPQLIAQISKSEYAKQNVTKLVLKLLKENQVLKKCMNVLIKNQQSFNHSNNVQYFEQITKQEHETEKQKSQNSAQLSNSAKQNCSLM